MPSPSSRTLGKARRRSQLGQPEHGPDLGISVPIEWEELGSISSSAHWTIKNIESRLAIGNQPWQGYASAAQGLTSAMKALGFNPPKP